MRIGLLGPLEVCDGGADVAVPGARLRALLALLALQPGRPVAVDRIVSGLWGADAPAGAANALQSLVSRLRRVVPAAIRSLPAGYQVDVAASDVDTERFAERVAAGRGRLSAGDPLGAAAELRDALALWRGPALVDVSAPFAAPVATRLAAERLAATGDLAEAYLAGGSPEEAALTVTGPAAEHPMDERLCALAVRALYAAGRQADALAAYQATRRALADELGIDPSAELAAVHLTVLRGEPSADAAARSGATNLRTAVSSFIGRDREIREIRKLLADTRLVTLVGPGGTGKTRLAGEAASGLLDRYPDGVWLVELAPVSDPVDVPHAVFAALGATAPTIPATTHNTGPAIRDRAEQLRALLADRHLLLVLDNCEHVIDAAAQLADTVLAHCPGVRVLATSRAPLGITGEKLYPVPALELPAEGADADTAGTTAAVRLLVDRAAAVRPGFAVDDGNVAAVTQICRRLDGAPLALELAAARLRTLTAAQVAERLDDRFRLLTAGDRTAPGRHQTLQAVVSWSWDLLDEPQRALARRLSVFAGGASLDALDAVCAGGPLPVDAVLDALTGLVDQSLVDAGEDGRYRMLETLRAYGADRLAEAGETTAVRAAHVAHHLRLAERLEPLLRTAQQDTAMSGLTAEYDNLVTALRYAVDAGDAESALRLGAAQLWYSFLLGYAGDVTRWLREVMSVAPDEPPAGLAAAYALCYLGSELESVGEYVNQPERVRRKVERFERLADTARAEGPLPPVLALARCFPAMLAGDHQASRDLLTELVDGPDRWTAAAARMLRANLARGVTGSRDDAGTDAERAVAAFRDIGEQWGLSAALVGYGEHLVAVGDLDRAADVLAEAWDVARHFMPPSEQPGFLVRLAGIRVRAGDVDTAERELAEAAALRASLPPGERRRGPDWWFQPEMVAAEVHRARGRYDDARDSFRRIQRWADQKQGTRPPQVAAYALNGLARVELDAGRPDTAETLVYQGMRRLASSRDLPLLIYLVETLVLAAGDRDPRRTAVLAGCLGALSTPHIRREPAVRDAVDAARAALGPDEYARATEHGAGLDFVGVYDYLDVPVKR
ncbi:MAG TPA: BTAD domain-containing putative transcriptional regulator [Actinocatenispora sp.]